MEFDSSLQVSLSMKKCSFKISYKPSLAMGFFPEQKNLSSGGQGMPGGKEIFGCLGL
jgi:hypothetical protein